MRKLIGISAFCLSVLFPITGQSATVNTVACGGFTCATSIDGLDVAGTTYDVVFVTGTFNNVNDGTNFPFLGDAITADLAAFWINSALNSSPDNPDRVGNGDSMFRVPHTVASSVSFDGGSYSSTIPAWVDLTGGSTLTSDGTWATFTVVPLPAAAWLFISAVGGLVVAKRRQLKA